MKNESAKMSSILTIEPTHRQKETLSDELKFALRKRWQNGCSSTTFDAGSIGYFRGLLDAGIEDAQKVIDMIEKYDEVTIREEY